MKVGLKDINRKELQDGQRIKIYDKINRKIAIEGTLKYVPGAFLIVDSTEGHDLLLYWYIREDKMFDYHEYTERERFDIEILE